MVINVNQCQESSILIPKTQIVLWEKRWTGLVCYPAVVQWEEPSINQATSGERSTIYAIVKSHDINDRTDSLMGFFNRIPMGLKLHKMVFHLGISQDKGVP